MAKFVVCPDCGSHLDAGEKCDCKKKKGTPQNVKVPNKKVHCEFYHI